MTEPRRIVDELSRALSINGRIEPPRGTSRWAAHHDLGRHRVDNARTPMDSLELDSDIAALDADVDAAAEGVKRWRDVWESIRSINDEFRMTAFASREARDQAWQRFQDVIGRAKDLQAEGRRDAEEQTSALLLRIAELRRAVDAAGDGNAEWKDIWASIRGIGGAFKETRFPTRDARESAWSRFQETVEHAKSLQDAERERRRAFAVRSGELKHDIVATAEAGEPPTFVDPIFTPLIELVTDVATLGLLRESDEERQLLDHWSQQLRVAWQRFSDHKAELLGRDKHEIFERLRESQDRLDQRWERWRQARHQAHEARQSARRERIEANILKNEERLRRLYEVLAHKEEHLRELDDKRSSAWSDGFRERVEGWIQEEQDAISDIKDKVRQIEAWVEEGREQLR